MMKPAWTFTVERQALGQAVEGKPILDALDEARGNWASCIVDGKVDCSFDAEKHLRLFACECALRALHRERKAGREPHADLWRAAEVTTRFANGLASKGELADALAAARAASWAASWAASKAVARAASWVASWAASWAASQAASWAASWAASHAASWAASQAASWAASWAASKAVARAASWDASWAASQAASWDAAWATERQVQTDMLLMRFDECMEKAG